jgi:hypothetical protein
VINWMFSREVEMNIEFNESAVGERKKIMREN